MGDFSPALTIREMLFPAPTAASRLMLLGSNSLFFPIGEEEREPLLLRSREPERERDRERISRRACLRDDPRGCEMFARLDGGVLVDVTCCCTVLRLDGPGSDVAVTEDAIGGSSPEISE